MKVPIAAAARQGIVGRAAIVLCGLILITDQSTFAQSDIVLFDFEAGVPGNWVSFGSPPAGVLNSSAVNAHSGNIAIEFRQSQFAAGTNGFGGFFSDFALSPTDWTSFGSISYWVKSSSTGDANRVQIEMREAGNEQQWIQRVPTVMSPTYQEVVLGFNTIDFERSVIGSNTNDTTLDLDNIDRVIFVFKPNLPLDPPIAIGFVDDVMLLTNAPQIATSFEVSPSSLDFGALSASIDDFRFNSISNNMLNCNYSTGEQAWHIDVFTTNDLQKPALVSSVDTNFIPLKFHQPNFGGGSTNPYDPPDPMVPENWNGETTAVYKFVFDPRDTMGFKSTFATSTDSDPLGNVPFSFAVDANGAVIGSYTGSVYFEFVIE